MVLVIVGVNVSMASFITIVSKISQRIVKFERTYIDVAKSNGRR